MRYNLVNILKKLAFTFAVIVFCTGVTYAQNTASLLGDEPINQPNNETVANVEGAYSVDSSFWEEPVENPVASVAQEVKEQESSILNDFDKNPEGFLAPQAKVVAEQEASNSDDINDSFDGFADLEINQSEIDEINNSIGSQPQKITPEPVRKIAGAEVVLGEDLIANIDEDLFSQMSSIEKQTSLLTLELRREKIKTEIEAIRIARAKALQEEENAKELKIREKKEWELKQQKILLVEQEKLAKARAAEEQLRQEKIIHAYKAQMLKETENWIKALEVAYSKVKEVEKDRDENLLDFRHKVTDLASRATLLGTQAEQMKENYVKTIANYQAQITALSSRIDSLNEGVSNPFSNPGFGSTDDPNIKLSEEYIVLEITGKGENLKAKISNKTGDQAFLVQKGTALKTGHIIEEIAPTFIRADRGGIKDFIYFTAGGILDKEPDSELKIKNIPASDPASEEKKKPQGYSTTNFLNGMFVD